MFLLEDLESAQKRLLALVNKLFKVGKHRAVGKSMLLLLLLIMETRASPANSGWAFECAEGCVATKFKRRSLIS
jgi:hypothetical protein